ncbi:rhomboid-domain-containing protein, partial [Calocera cornea HHB12733]
PPRSPPPPPKQSWWKRFTQRLDRLPQNYVTGGIIGLNVLVWMQWKVGWQNFSRFKDEQPLRFLFENFATSWENYRAGRWWTLITAAFSQMEEGHLLINCLSLWFTADAVMSVIGVSRFMGVYLLGGVASSIVSIWWRGDKQGHSLGASGAVYACLSLFGLMFPTTKFLIFFVLPVPAWACIGGILAWDLWGMFSKQGGSDNAGHVGGILAGAAMY